jgi:4-amino-4-deoxy-L-arabinose transferase-like glycosyltransferase
MTPPALTIVALLIAAALAGAPTTRAAVTRALDRVRDPSPRQRWITAAIVFVVSVAYMGFTAWQQDRDLIPKFHDEHMHLVQMRHLAHGKLWTRPHELAEFFETFHVFVTPVYASVYFPGTALMYLPAVWLKLPFWLLPLLVAAGGGAAMSYRVTAELIDGVAGLLAALMVVSLQWFRYLSLMVMSHSVMLLLGLLILWSWLRWRRAHSLRWAAGLGAFVGWAAITRPVDAICYTAPVALAMLLDFRNLSPKRIALTIACAIASAAPFLALQVIENIGITGHPLKTPYRLYADLYTPQMSFGFHDFDPTVRPQTTLRQRQDYYDQFTIPAAAAHRPDRIARTWLTERFPLLATVTLPNRLLALLAPLSVLALTTVPRAATWAVLVIYIAFYAMFAYLLPVYCVVVAPVAIVWVLLGKSVIERWAARSARWRDASVAFLTTAAALLSIATLPGIDREVIDDGFLAPTMWFSYVDAPKAVERPAIILFRYTPGDNTNEEPVYNVDVVNPDDAPIIRAHDLGPQRNRELFAYYAQRQPDRNVYHFDRRTRTLTPLGKIADLAPTAAPAPATATTTTTTTTTTRPITMKAGVSAIRY